MNKRIIDSTKEEIKQAYQSNCISLIHSKRVEALNYEYVDVENGLFKPVCEFGLVEAQRQDLGLEFRLWNSNKKRKSRLTDKVSEIISSNNAIFITMTFKDSVLEKTTSETRRRKIARYLKSNCIKYVANIDFGVNDNYTKREHYHAIAIPKNESIDFKEYSKLFDKSRIDVEQVRNTDKSVISIKLYINKLTNHAYKSFGFAKRLIYSRN